MSRKPSHEAGFDSFLTAKVLIRLSAKLYTANRAVQEETYPESDEDHDMTPDDGGVSLIAPIPGDEIDPRGNQSIGDSETGSEGVSLNPQPPKKKPKVVVKAAKISIHNPPRAGQANPAFSHATMFDLLGEIPVDDSLRSPGKQVKYQPKSGLAAAPRKRHDMIPPFESEFWNVYNNRLRVNGTVEGICRLDPESH